MKMKKRNIIISAMVLGGMLLANIGDVFAQEEKQMQYFRQNDQRGINVFETPVNDDTPFNGMYVKLGGHFTQQFQALWHTNEIPALADTAGSPARLKKISNGFNLATANMNIDAQLEDGIRIHLVTYLSSRHHSEAWVKSGYIQFDKLTVLNNDFVNRMMENMTIKVGHMEINYGDAHFRRTDNANAMYNPFIGNNIMDAFNTEVAAEVYWRKNGIILMGGVSEGLIKPDVGREQDSHDPSFYYKVGYDNEETEGLRWRLTLSNYIANKSQRNVLYHGDRGGSRYYYAMENESASATSQAWSGRWDPGFSNKIQSLMINPFVKYNGLEFFLTYEMATGQRNGEVDKDGEFATRTYTQLAADVVYRFFEDESFYIGAKYNTINGERTVEDDNPITINRIEAGLGWFITPTVLAKAHYVTQDYVDFQPGEIYNEGNFHGFMVEAVVGF